MGRMHNPPHPGESIREDILPALDLSVTAAAKLSGSAGLRTSGRPARRSTTTHGPRFVTATSSLPARRLHSQPKVPKSPPAPIRTVFP